MVIESTFLFLRPMTPHKTAASLVAPSMFVKDRVPRPQHHAIEFDLILALYHTAVMTVATVEVAAFGISIRTGTRYVWLV